MTYSPNRGYRLEELEGDPYDIETAGNEYTRMGERMQWTSDELDKLSSETRYKAEGLDAIREQAGELADQLTKVADRYTSSGPVLVTYASALRDARTRTVNPLVDDIVAAIAARDEAVAAREDAESAADDLRNPWPWQDEATDAQLATADQAASSAGSAASAAESDLEGLWESFESGYSVWEEAYERAVNDLETAYSASGIDDNPWEDAFDFIAQALTVIGTIAVVVAIFVAAPIAAVLLVIATVAAIATLAIHVGMMLAGSKRVTMGDLIFDTIAVIPFAGGVVKAMRGGSTFFRALGPAAGLGAASRSTITAGRNAVEDSVRTIVGWGSSGGGQAARRAAAGGIADDFLRTSVGNWGQGAWNAIRSGGGRLDGQALSMSENMLNAWPRPGGVPRASANNWLADVAASGRPMQGINVGNFFNGIEQSVSTGVSAFGGPDIPTVADIPGLDFNPLAR